MRFRRMRYLALFLAAMLFANNAAAAIRACIADLAGQEHLALHTLAATGNDDLCPQSDDAGPCLKHYAQSYQDDEQLFWADFRQAAPAPVVAVLRVSFPAKPKLIVLASAAPIVGPSLTILYRNFRN